MAFVFTAVLVDSFNKGTTVRHTMTAPDYTTAVSDAANILSAYLDHSDALVRSMYISEILQEGTTLPSGEVTIAEEAVINVHLNPPSEAPKLHTLRIPAPTNSAVFYDDTPRVVDPNKVQDFFDALDSLILVSDGETMDRLAEPAGTLRYKAVSYKS